MEFIAKQRTDLTKEAWGALSQVNAQGASIIQDQRLKLTEAEANLQEAQHDVILETKLNETNWNNFEATSEEIKRVKLSTRRGEPPSRASKEQWRS